MSDKPKFGAGALSAAIRQGWGEIGTLVKAFPDSVQVEALGGIGNPTPQEIFRGKLDESSSNATAKDREIEME